MKVAHEFYLDDSVTRIARNILGKIIFTNKEQKFTAGIISETEAYAGIYDKASHAFNNRRTERTEIMYSQGGVAYVYLCYGVHHLFNIVTNQKDIPDAVLLRGIIPFKGIAEMEERSGKKNSDSGFSNGPGKSSKALGIKLSDNGISLCGDEIWLEDAKFKIKDNDILVGPRIGVEFAGKDALLPYRFMLTPEAIVRLKKRAQQNTELF